MQENAKNIAKSGYAKRSIVATMTPIVPRWEQLSAQVNGANLLIF
jgi:hypothetical protein